MLWLLTAGRRPLLILLLSITLLMAAGLTQLRVEEDTRSMTSIRPEQQQHQQRLRELFGNDEVLMVSLTPPLLLSQSGLELLAELTARIGALDGVARVLSLGNAGQSAAGRYGAEERPLLEKDDGGAFAVGKLRDSLQRNPLYQDLLISADRRTAGLLVVPADRPDDARHLPDLIRGLRTLLGEYGDRAEVHLTGVAVQKNDVAELIRRDQRTVLPLVVAVLTTLLAVAFRRPGGVLLPLAATAVSLVWTMGLYALCGYQLNTISALLPPVVMILAVSNSVHLYNGWLHADGSDRRRSELLAARFGELLAPCGFTALTTAFGLLSLTLSSIPAVRQFGLFAALGVLFSLLVSLLVVPIGLSFQPLPDRRTRSGIGLLRRLLDGVAGLTIRRARTVLAAAVLLLALAALGLPRLQNNTNLVGFLLDRAPLVIDTAYIDRHLGGVNALEFMLSRSDGRPLDGVADYRALERFEQRTSERPGVAKVISVLPLLRQLHRAETGGEKTALPENGSDLHYELELLARSKQHDQAARYLTDDRRTARFSILLHDIGSRSALALTEQLEHAGQEIFAAEYRLVPTGSYYQVILDSQRLVGDMLKSFSLSLFLVMLAILALLRSFRLTLLAVIPNIIPILWTLGLMGFLRIDLSTGTAMIGAVAFGLAVDDTIHYLVHFRRVRSLGVETAVRTTTTRIGRALLITTLALALGFWTGCFGSFKPTIYFSLLVGGTLLGALLCDLLVLPASLVLWPSASRGRAT